MDSSSSLTPLRTGQDLGLSARTQRYPTPFLDISSFYLPRTIKSLFRWCRLYMYSNPVIAGVVRKKSLYPLTGLRYKHDNKEIRERWKRFFEEHLRLKSHLFEMSLDVQAYGNAFSSIYFPIRRYLVCEKCRKHILITAAKFEWRNFRFEGECDRCQHRGEFKIRDVEFRYRDVNQPCQVRLVRWPVDLMEVDYVHISGEHIYRYILPGNLRKKILQGHVDTLASYPPEFFEAMRNRSFRIRFERDRVFHWKRPGISSEEMAWGEPAIMSCLKSLFVMQLFIKAREMLAHQHVVPLWVLFPQPIGNIDPFRALDLADWRRRVEDEIRRWIQNANYIPIMPIPLGSQFIGGNANKLSVTEDIKALESDILVGLGVPPEFAYSGSWSGSSIAIRLLENDFVHTQEDQLLYANRFLIPRLSRHTGWPPLDVGFSDLRLQDDVQRRNFQLAMSERGMLSKGAILDEANEDFEEQLHRIEQEQNLEAELTEKTMLRGVETQAKAAQENMRHQIRMQLLQDHVAKQVVQELTEEGFDAKEIEAIQQRLMAGGGFNIQQDLSFLKTTNGNGNADKRHASARYAGTDGQYENYHLNLNQHISPWAAALLAAPPDKRDAFLKSMQTQMPNLFYALMKEMRDQVSGHGAAGVDTRPMPEQNPPRRQGAM